MLQISSQNFLQKFKEILKQDLLLSFFNFENEDLAETDYIQKNFLYKRSIKLGLNIFYLLILILLLIND